MNGRADAAGACVLRRIAVVALTVAACALVVPTGVAAATLQLEQMTWTELRDAVRGGKTTILVPIGGTEQNGPHMALGKHNVRAAALAERIAAKLGNAIVAPVIAYVPEGSIDPPTAHMRFAGTISIAPAAFVGVLEGAARSFRAHGFRDIVFLGDHGGYQKEERLAAEHLNREWSRTNVRAHALEEYYRVTETAYPQALKARGFSDQEIGLHAGLADTSLTLAIDPHLVRMDRLATATGNGSGVQGDPRRASADLGEVGVDLIVTQTVEAIRRVTTRH